jgi:hypothetical protein
MSRCDTFSRGGFNRGNSKERIAMKTIYILLIVGILALIVGCGTEQKSLLPSVDDTYKGSLSPDWKLYSEIEGPEGWVSKSYYDAQSIIKMKEGYTRVWVKQYDENTAKGPPAVHPTNTNLIEINCTMRIVRYPRIIRHSKDGRVEGEESRMNWGYISSFNDLSSFSDLDALHKAICGSLNK